MGIGLSGLTETWQICAPIRALRLRADMGHVCYQELAHSANAFFRKVAPLSWPTDRGCATGTSRGRRGMAYRPGAVRTVADRGRRGISADYVGPAAQYDLGDGRQQAHRS